MDIHHDLQVPREGQPENATVAALAAQNLALREALETGIKSAHPHPTEHPTMTAAWAVMRAALALPLPDAAREVEGWKRALEAIADGEGDAQQIALAALRAAKGGGK
jgi:hypothetical protein